LDSISIEPLVFEGEDADYCEPLEMSALRIIQHTPLAPHWYSRCVASVDFSLRLPVPERFGWSKSVNLRVVEDECEILSLFRGVRLFSHRCQIVRERMEAWLQFLETSRHRCPTGFTPQSGRGADAQHLRLIVRESCVPTYHWHGAIPIWAFVMPVVEGLITRSYRPCHNYHSVWLQVRAK